MAAGAEVVQNLQADAATYTGGIEARTISAQTPEVYYSTATNKKPAAVASARRSTLSSADATAALNNSTYTSNLIDLGNSPHIALSCRFSVSGTSAAVFLALYDASNALIGVTRDFNFNQVGTYTDGTLYLSVVELVDVHAASKYFPVLRTAPTSGNVSIYAEHL